MSNTLSLTHASILLEGGVRLTTVDEGEVKPVMFLAALHALTVAVGGYTLALSEGALLALGSTLVFDDGIVELVDAGGATFIFCAPEGAEADEEETEEGLLIPIPALADVPSFLKGEALLAWLVVHLIEGVDAGKKRIILACED